MRITFLIGNGFDINLGLNTTFSDFVKVYKSLDSKSEHVKAFREHIKDNEKKWSAAEEALGQYTSCLGKGQGAIFSECQADFCAQLAIYLKKQQAKINYKGHQDEIKKAFSQFQTLSSPFSTVVRDKLNTICKNHRSENTHYCFINFNYTDTLDQCLSIVKNFSETLGSHKYYGRMIQHDIASLCHVHGTVNNQMVFGVNDESQIAKPEVFDGYELGKKFLIKKSTNEYMGENTDTTATKILQGSHIIYTYGMSLGRTDILWWTRICKWLMGDPTRHLIIHQYEMPPKGAFEYNYLNFETNTRHAFMQLGGVPNSQWCEIEDRIHVTNYNIFKDIQDIASPVKTGILNPSHTLLLGSPVHLTPDDLYNFGPKIQINSDFDVNIGQ